MNILRELRESQALRQQDLADRAGVGCRTIRRIEAGEGRPSFRTIRALSGALRCKIADLLPLRDRECPNA